MLADAEIFRAGSVKLRLVENADSISGKDDGYEADPISAASPGDNLRRE
jgi:hypothetical protein